MEAEQRFAAIAKAQPSPDALSNLLNFYEFYTPSKEAKKLLLEVSRTHLLLIFY